MKILFFAPYSGIWTHAFPEALIAETLQQRGHEIVYITCDQSFEGFCTAMTAVGMTFEADPQARQKVCQGCKKNKNLIVNTFKFRNSQIKDYLSQDDYAEIERTLQRVSQENLLDLVCDDIEIGRLTLYQMLLEYKKSSLVFSEKEWQRVKIDLKNVLITFYAARKIFRQESPQALVVYNALYASNHVFCKLAEKLNIKQYFLHAGGNLATRLETMIFAYKDPFIYYQDLLQKWHEVKHIPCPTKWLKQVTAHLLSVICGQTLFSYSEKVNKNQVNLREYFGINKEQKVILAAMSSGDERFSASIVKAYPEYKILFANQFCWLKAVIDYVKDRPDLFLIIRVHPREFVNRRDSVVSENYYQMKELFDQLPDNVKINWPADEISLYYLAQEIDLCLNAWSSAGKELAALGIPVLLYAKEIQVYPPELNEVGETLDEYFNLLNQAIEQGWDFERIRKVYRWYALEYFRSTFDISDGFKDKRYNLLERAYRKALRLIDDKALLKIDCRKRPQRLKEGALIGKMIEEGHNSLLEILDADKLAGVSLEDETLHLKAQLKVIYAALKGNNNKETTLLTKFRKFLEAESQDEHHHIVA